MAFGNNSVLINAASANKVDLLADGLGDFYAGTAGSDVYVIENGITGDDTLSDFDTFDSLVTGKKIYDSNNDGYVWFGDNEVLDLDRYGSGAGRAGQDQLTFTGDMRGVRYLGTKDNVQFVYADAYVRTKLEAAIGKTVIEGTVGDDILDATGGDKVFLYDTALGLNLGGDTINGFGKGDYLVTTQKLFDSNLSTSVNFGHNGVLDLAGGVDPEVTGGDVGTAGQIKFDVFQPKDGKAVYYLQTLHVDVHGIDTVYYVYGGTADTAHLV